MQEPPEDFLYVEPSRYEHKYSHGKRGQYWWLISNRYTTSEALHEARLPAEGFRLLQPAWQSTRGDEEVRGFLLSQPMAIWNDHSFGEWFVLKSSFEGTTLRGVENELKDLLDGANCSTYKRHEDELLWSIIEAIEPEYYFYDLDGSCMITKNEQVLTACLDSELFKTAEEREHRWCRKSKYNFWQSMAPECGPQKCIEPECERLRIQWAVRCIQHQYAWGSLPICED